MLYSLRINWRMSSSYWGICCLIATRSHSIDWSSFRTATRRSLLASVGGPTGRSAQLVDSHWSDQTLMFLPEPTIHPSLFKRTSLPAITPLQPWEADWGAEALRKGSVWQYFPISVWERREFGCLSARQARFSRRAWLNFSIYLKPKPPAPFGV